MRLLSSIEFSSVSAGSADCVDTKTFAIIQGKAIQDGVMRAALTTHLTMIITLALFNKPINSVLTGLIVAPYVAAAGYIYSSAWDAIQQ